MKDGQPKAIYLKDYKVPPHLIEETNLHVDIFEEETTVVTTLKVSRNPDVGDEDAADLLLDGSTDLETIPSRSMGAPCHRMNTRSMMTSW